MLNTEQLIAQVEQAGYQAAVVQQQNESLNKNTAQAPQKNYSERRQLEADELFKKLIVAIILALPVFVLEMETLDILNCIESVTSVYDYNKYKIIKTPFTNLFPEDERKAVADEIRNSSSINQAKQIRSDGNTIYVNIRISPSEYGDQKVYLVTTSDITKRL